MYRLPDISDPLDFPNDFKTSSEGLLALGGNLHPITLIHAYAKGLFPWFSEGDPILWWHPDPRLIFFPDKIHISTKMRKILKTTTLVPRMDPKGFGPNLTYQVTVNRAFADVMRECADKRGKGRDATWIQSEFLSSYGALHQKGYAQSLEVWNSKGRLVGGVYGVSIGKIFFGESMFSHEPNASKIALIWLCERLVQKGYLLLDGQVSSPHLLSMGAEEIPRDLFLEYLKKGGTKLKKPGENLEIKK